MESVHGVHSSRSYPVADVATRGGDTRPSTGTGTILEFGVFAQFGF